MQVKSIFRTSPHIFQNIFLVPIFDSLRKSLTGELFTDTLHRRLYATDASIYKKMPLAVACPANEADISLLIQFARNNRLSLIPRTAGTSLAGQCVGEGIVVDVSKHFTKIPKFHSKFIHYKLTP